MADGIAPTFPERKLEVRSGSSAVPYSRLLNSTDKTTGASEINKLTVALFFRTKSSSWERTLLLLTVEMRVDDDDPLLSFVL